MYLSSLAESTEGFGLPWEGIASAVREDENIHHYLGQGQRVGWTVTVDEASQ